MTDKDFTKDALMHLEEYARNNRRFLIEDVGEYAYTNGLKAPLEPRWWGTVAVAARNKGLIKTTGYYKKSRFGNARPMPVWESKTFGYKKTSA